MESINMRLTIRAITCRNGYVLKKVCDVLFFAHWHTSYPILAINGHRDDIIIVQRVVWYSE